MKHATALPTRIHDEIVRVVLGRDENTTMAQIARDLGVHEATINKLVRQAEFVTGNHPGSTTDQTGELRGLRHRIRLLEQESDVLPRTAEYLSRANLPSRGSTFQWRVRSVGTDKNSRTW